MMLLCFADTVPHEYSAPMMGTCVGPTTVWDHDSYNQVQPGVDDLVNSKAAVIHVENSHRVQELCEASCDAEPQCVGYSYRHETSGTTFQGGWQDTTWPGACIVYGAGIAQSAQSTTTRATWPRGRGTWSWQWHAYDTSNTTTIAGSNLHDLMDGEDRLGNPVFPHCVPVRGGACDGTRTTMFAWLGEQQNSMGSHECTKCDGR
jgi:hypothetical protein